MSKNDEIKRSFTIKYFFVVLLTSLITSLIFCSVQYIFQVQPKQQIIVDLKNDKQALIKKETNSGKQIKDLRQDIITYKEMESHNFFITCKPSDIVYYNIRIENSVPNLN